MVVNLDGEADNLLVWLVFLLPSVAYLGDHSVMTSFGLKKAIEKDRKTLYDPLCESISGQI